MTPPSYHDELRAALAAVRQAAALCRTVRSEVGAASVEKQDKSPVTVADFGSQALVCRALVDAFPDDPVVGEEDADALRSAGADVVARVVEYIGRYRPGATERDVCAWIDRGVTLGISGRFWALDPIDGTKGFLRNEQYAVALALVVGGKVAVAALACPNLGGPGGVAFTAVEGQGAWAHDLTAEPDAAAAPVRVSRRDDPATAVFCESVESGHSAHGASAEVARRLGIVAAPVRLDSQAKYGVVARGEADIYLRLPTRADYREKIWDHAAGALVVTEAGGRVTDVTGAPLDFARGRELAANRGVVVSNGALHDRVVAAVRAAGVT
jgi:3'(2'), 5'-bisphosphate nucleotidase